MAHRTALKAALVGALMAFAPPASAADLDLDDGYDVGGDTRVIVKVHNRGFRHCHWIDGDRVCHRRLSSLGAAVGADGKLNRFGREDKRGVATPSLRAVIWFLP